MEALDNLVSLVSLLVCISTVHAAAMGYVVYHQFFAGKPRQSASPVESPAKRKKKVVRRAK